MRAACLRPGAEESGKLSRELTKASYYGTLSTLQTAAAGNPAMAGFPCVRLGKPALESRRLPVSQPPTPPNNYICTKPH